MMVALIEVSAAMAMMTEIIAPPLGPKARCSRSAAIASERLMAARPRPFQ
jgi:hypothetical protein